MSGLVDRHISFLESLRGAGLSVSLAEDLDAIAALRALDWHDRTTVKEGYAATLVKKASQRPTFDLSVSGVWNRCEALSRNSK